MQAVACAGCAGVDSMGNTRLFHCHALPACNVCPGLALCSALFLTPISNKPNGGERLDDGVHRGRTCQTPFQRLKHPPPVLRNGPSPGLYPKTGKTGKTGGVNKVKPCSRDFTVSWVTPGIPGRESGGGCARRAPQSPHVPDAEQYREPPRASNYARISLQ